jgi:acetyl-CoA synthetase
MAEFSWELMWKLVSGSEDRLNVGYECVDRHPRDRTALRIQYEDGRTETCDFGRLSDLSSQWAHFLAEQQVVRGERVALLMQPSVHFYAALFGAVKRGAVAVPLYPLFGPEGLALRLAYAKPKIVLTDEPDKAQVIGQAAEVVHVDATLSARVARLPTSCETFTTAADDAFIQFTSGTTRMMPQPIHHKHRTVVTALMPAIYGYGVAREDRFLCVSPPSWGHGLSFGTIAPLALGTSAGAVSGKFDVIRLLQALQEFRITNISAAPTVYRALRNSGRVGDFDLCLKRVSYTGEAMDGDTFRFIEAAFGTPPCGVYGTAEVSSFLGNFCGFSGFEVKPGSLGKPLPGKEVGVFDDGEKPTSPNQIGEIRLKRRGEWYHSKDIGYVDEEGYFYHSGRNDDVIISAGWTISPLEIENVLLQHPDVLEAAVVASPDALRGYVPKAFVVALRQEPAFVSELQNFVKTRLSQSQYPRKVEFLSEIPKTTAGKIDRRALRAAEISTAPVQSS